MPEGANSEPMMAQTSFDLAAVAAPTPVPPGAETEIALTLTAPAQVGRVYRSRWQLRGAHDGPGDRQNRQHPQCR